MNRNKKSKQKDEMVKRCSPWVPKEPKPEPEDMSPEPVLPLRSIPASTECSDSSSEEEEGESGELRTELKVQEQSLMSIVEYRKGEVERFRSRVAKYQKKLADTERRKHELESKLASVRSQIKETSAQRDSTRSLFKESYVQKISDTSPVYNRHEETSQRKRKSKSILVIPDVPVPRFTKCATFVQGEGSTSMTGANLASTRHFEGPIQIRAETSYEAPPNHGRNISQASDIKRKKVCRERNLIPYVSSCSSARVIHCHSSTYIRSQHTKKLRSLSLCPTNDRLFITSALDGTINSWQLKDNGSGATLLNNTECLTPKLKRWPEDVAWHPAGGMLFAVYTADAGENQISIIDFGKKNGHRLRFIQEKPHWKGIINSILFMPWNDSDVYFATGGSDHSVLLWKESENNIWKPNILHRDLHSAAAMGVAGLRQKKIVMSVGSDKRIIGYDVDGDRVVYKYKIETRCMSVLPNPLDFNLFMVQTAAPEKQLRLYDIRLKHAEIHAFGWTQKCGDTQPTHVKQAWSFDGLYITSGSADPKIHIFDIRYKGNQPCLSVQAHEKRVFKAVWHPSIPVLMSISTDLHLGLHQIS